MHHKIIGGGLGGGRRQNGLRIKAHSNQMLGGFGDYYESDDESSNMINVGYDHVPLTPGLSHAVRLELGSDPMVLGPERKISDADDYDDDEDSASTSSAASNPSFLLHHDEPIGIRPLYKKEPTMVIEPETTNQYTLLPQTNTPMLYNTTRSKDVLQLKLAMQKETEFDGLYRDMDHRIHCIHTYKPVPPRRKRSRSHSPVPQVIAVSPEVPLAEPARKRKSPPPASPSVATAAATVAAAVATVSDVATPSPARRGSPLLLKSAYIRRPHKKRKATKANSSSTTKASGNKAEKQKSAKAAKSTKSTKKSPPPPPKKPSPQKLDDSEEDTRFKRFQNNQWSQKFQELLKFRKENGHCQVPHTWPPNPQLARWVKRQRYQFKLRCEGKLSTMTEDRIQLLDEAGFVWDSHAAAWQEKYEELKDYVNKHKTFNMGSSYATHPQLATWVKCQRRQYKLLMAGEESNMTPERKDLLEKLGFLWGVRKPAK
mmetsp:Transcript_15086/g.36934  ORF Transcript_15086/g.36934 Transcript_15086/m.36934 type:complete len:485 (-) Transcript_15086:839-2293(-)